MTYSNWNAGEPNEINLYECSDPCALLIPHGWKWNDEICGDHRNGRCVCQVDNATRDGAKVYEIKEQAPEEVPFLGSQLALALVVLSMALVASARAVVAHTGNADARVASAVNSVPEHHNSGKMATTLKEESEEERKAFAFRLDDTARFLGFRNEEEERLFAKTKRDVGIEDVCVTLTHTLPSLCLYAGVAELVMVEGWNSLPGLGQGVTEREYGGRPQIMTMMAAALLLFSIGFFTPKRSITAELFPYFSFACALLYLITIFLCMWPMIRHGSLS